MFYLENLSSTELVEGCAPWEWPESKLADVPEECFKSKSFRDIWVNRPTTKWHCYSPCEGVHSRMRITKGGVSGEDQNPPLVQNFLPIDSDILTSPEEARKFANAMRKPPAWFEQTFSNHGRYIWAFERPIMHACRAFHRAFHERIHELLDLHLLPAVDKAALLHSSLYFTNGARWTRLSDYVIPETEMTGFLEKVVHKFNFVRKELGKASDLKKVAEECARRYPRFAEWTSDFSADSQGPSFWLPGSKSPKSAIVKDNGMFTFSASRTKPFYPWAEIVGPEFVEETENNRMGESVKDIYFNGHKFFYKDEGGDWHDAIQEHIRLRLHVAFGLGTRSDKSGAPSEVDRALHYIITHNRVDEAAPCPFYPKGIFKNNGKRILNLHKGEVIPAAELWTPWGTDGKFPTLCAFLDPFFTTPDQLPRFLTWLKRAYVGFRDRRPLQSHGLVLCGPPGKGKTFTVRGFIGQILGGWADAGPFWAGQDIFNSELFRSGLWCRDDGSALSSELLHRIMSEKTKQSIANDNHRYNGKYQAAANVPSGHKTCITCNDDPESVCELPKTDISSLDKWLILRISADSPFVFPSKPEMEDIVQREAPYFLRWLVDYQPPDFVVEGCDSRFGMNSYCEPSLLRASNQSSPVNGFYELLVKWLRNYFEFEQPGATFWEGNGIDLRVAMSANPIFSELLRPYRQDRFNRFLAQIQNKNLLKISITDHDSERIWRIERDDRFKKPVAATPPQSLNSPYEKL